MKEKKDGHAGGDDRSAKVIEAVAPTMASLVAGDSEK